MERQKEKEEREKRMAEQRAVTVQKAKKLAQEVEAEEEKPRRSGGRVSITFSGFGFQLSLNYPKVWYLGLSTISRYAVSLVDHVRC